MRTTFTLPPWTMPTNSLPFRTMDPGEVIRAKDMRKIDPDFLQGLIANARQMLTITRGTRFPGGIAVTGADEMDKVRDAVELTRQLVERKDVPAIFAGAFYLHDASDAAVNRGVLVRPEILERLPDGTFHLIEVTASTKVEKKDLIPLAAKKHVLDRLGVQVTRASVVVVNSAYTYAGGEPDMAQLLILEDCTEKLGKDDVAAAAERFIQETKDLLARGVANTDQIPEEKVPLHHISRLTNVLHTGGNQHHTKKKKILAYAAEHGITDIRELPLDLPNDVLPLSVMQRRQILVLKTGKPYVDRPGLRAALAKLKFPVYHMDFETTQAVIPPFPGTKPYQQIPYQYSVHPMNQTGSVTGENLVFLHDGEGDPRQAFIEKLIRDVGADKGETGSIIACNQDFEKKRLEEIVATFPQYKDAVDNIISRLYDIQDIVREFVYFAEFDGSVSLKKMFPALVANPETRYEDLVIQNGSMASAAIQEMISPVTTPERKRHLFDALVKYCGLDTFSMVEIYRALVVLAEGTDGVLTPEDLAA